MNALLKSTDIENANFELIEIAKSWNDERLLPFLMTHLDQVQNTSPPSVERVMQIIAQLLDDEKVNGLLDQYRNDASYEDLEVKQSEDASDSSGDEDETDQSAEASSADDEAEKPKLSPDAARRVRAAIVEKFIEAARAKIKQHSNQ